MIRTAVCPWSWKARSLRSTTVWPRGGSGREGAIPSFTRSGRPSDSLRSSSCSDTTSCAPKTSRERSGAGMTIGDATSENATRAYHGAAVSERRGPVRSATAAPPSPAPRGTGSARHRRLGPVLAGVLALAVLAQGCRIPDLHEVQSRARRLPQTSFLYADDGSLVTTFHAEQNRVSVPFEDIPKVVRDAVVAIEDQRFYEHEGIDLKAL